jgi:hypothetical protein
LTQNVSPVRRENHEEEHVEPGGIQRQHDGPVLTVGIRVLARQEELAKAKIGAQRNAHRSYACPFAYEKPQEESEDSQEESNHASPNHFHDRSFLSLPSES